MKPRLRFKDPGTRDGVRRGSLLPKDWERMREVRASVGLKVARTRASGKQSGTQFTWGSIPLRRSQARGLYTRAPLASKDNGGRVATFDTRG